MGPTSGFVSNVFLLQLLLLLVVAIGPLSCYSHIVEDSTRPSYRSGQDSSFTTTNPRGIRATLIPNDKGDGDLSSAEKLHRDATHSVMRAPNLFNSRRNALDDWETPLSDLAIAEYLMQFSLGTPAQQFTVIADTGSDLTWLQCKPCKTCFPQTEALFDPTKSSTYASLSCASPVCEFLNDSATFCPYDATDTSTSTGCAFTYNYGDGSTTSGTIATDTISIASVAGPVQSVPKYEFGCSHSSASNSSLFDHTDGLVGLGRGLISFPSQLGTYFGNKFGYCLVNKTVDNGKAESPLYFGDAAVPTVAANGPQLQFTPIISNPITLFNTFYYVDCKGITLNGVAVDIPAEALAISSLDGSGGLFFDSGTTFTSLVSDAYLPLIDAVSSAITKYDRSLLGGIFDLCYVATWDEWTSAYGNSVPAISFQFRNTTGYNLSVINAWLKYNDLTVCFAILETTGMSIFGNIQQMGIHILYELDTKQIGFVQSDCNATALSSGSKGSSRGPSTGTSLVTMLFSAILLLFLSKI